MLRRLAYAAQVLRIFKHPPSLKVTNPNWVVVSIWRLKFLMHQAAITQSWNGTFEKQDSRYTVTPPDWGRDVQPNQPVSMGFCAKKLGTDYLPLDRLRLQALSSYRFLSQAVWSAKTGINFIRSLQAPKFVGIDNPFL